MSDDGDKPFEATPSRIAQARREGNVVRSAEFGANVAFVCACATSVAVVPAIASAAQDAIVRGARGEPAAGSALVAIAWALCPMAAAAAGGCIAALIQSGGLRVTAVTPKFERLAPGPSLGRMFSNEAAGHALRATVAAALAVACAVPAMRSLFAAALQNASVATVTAIAWGETQHVVAAVATIGLTFAFLEFGVARREWLRKLRMTFEEYRRERKEQEGDPTARARRRALHRAFARGGIARVREASFVVVNPTHVAVALQYRPPEIPVPVVLVRAAGDAALRARDVAREHGVPLIENVPLARALYRDGRVGAPIPLEQYVAVAEIVTSLMRCGALGTP